MHTQIYIHLAYAVGYLKKNQTFYSQDNIIILVQMMNCTMTHRRPNTLPKDNMLLKIILYAHQDVVMDRIYSYTPQMTLMLYQFMLFYFFLYLMLDTCLNSCNLI